MLQKTRTDLKIHKRRKHANPGETIDDRTEGKRRKENFYEDTLWLRGETFENEVEFEAHMRTIHKTSHLCPPIWVLLWK